MSKRKKPAARLLTSIARATIDAANTLLTRERAQIARDIQELDDIRSRVGTDAGEDLDDLRARYAAGEAGIDRPET